MTAEPIDHPRGQGTGDAHHQTAPGVISTAAASPDSAPKAVAPLRVVHSIGQEDLDAQNVCAGGATITPEGHTSLATQCLRALGGSDSSTGQAGSGAHQVCAGGGQDPDRASEQSSPKGASPGRGITPAAEAYGRPTPRTSSPRLLDPTLAMAADVIDDLERVRIGNENRLRHMTQAVEDADGELRGLGLDDDHPDVAILAAIVDGIAKVEHQAILNLQRAVRRHPLGPWVKAQKGVGEKQAGRLLAAVGDPYWNTLHDRPRTVSELWAYCGLHTLPVGHDASNAHTLSADGVKSGSSDLSHVMPSIHQDGAWVAARRQKGAKANWSTAAKMRAWNVAVSCMKQPKGSRWRDVYDARRAVTTERLHAAPCVRCGPSGKSASTGSPWSLGHQHADALRIVSKEILKDLWRAAREIHTTSVAGRRE